MERELIKQIVEAALLAADEPLNTDRLLALLEEEGEPPGHDLMREVLDELAADCEGRGVELKEVASGFRFQAREEVSRWVSRLWEERPPRYSRALLETLALVAYRQPITRAEIEEIRGVTVSTNIMRTLQEREWIRVVGHRDVPGRPAIYATTRQFLDYFNLKGLDDLPPLAELRDIDSINAELDLGEPDMQAGTETGSADRGPDDAYTTDDEGLPTAPDGDAEAEEALADPQGETVVEPTSRDDASAQGDQGVSNGELGEDVVGPRGAKSMRARDGEPTEGIDEREAPDSGQLEGEKLPR